MTKLRSIFEEAHVRKYPKGQILLYEGETTKDVFYINSGFVKVYDITAQGTEKLMLILGPEDIFPLIWTYGQTNPLHYFYETYDETEVSVLPQEKMLEASDSAHEVTKQLLEYFVDRSQDLMNRIDCIDATSAKHKVAQVLAYLAKAHGDQIADTESYNVRITITHQSIADMAGLTRETASIQLKELEKEKHYKGSGDMLTIHLDRIEDFLTTE